MLFESQLLAKASGSVGGLTFGHNQYGKWCRPRVTPSQPGSIYRLLIQGRFRQVVGYWNAFFMATRRAGWDTYAATNLRPNRLGHLVNIGGLAWFVRTNVLRLRAGMSLVPVAPSVNALAAFTPVTPYKAYGVRDIVSTYFNIDDEWCFEPQGAMLFFVGRPQNPSVTFFKGPYRYAGKLVGRAAPPLVSPVEIPSPFDITGGQRVFWRVRVVRADGRMSPSQQVTIICSA